MCHLLSDERGWEGWCSDWEVGAPGLYPTCVPSEGHLGCIPPASQGHCLFMLKPGVTPLPLH